MFFFQFYLLRLEIGGRELPFENRYFDNNFDRRKISENIIDLLHELCKDV